MSNKVSEKFQSSHFEHLFTIEGHASAVYSLTSCENFIYSASGDRFVTRWDKSYGKQDKFAIKLDSVPYVIRYLSEQSCLIIGLSDGKVHVIDIEKREEIKCFTQHRHAIFSIEDNMDRNHVYIGDMEGYLSIWNSNSWELEMIIPLNGGKIRSMLYSSDKKTLFVGKQNGEISLFETGYYNETRTFHAHAGGVSSLLYCEKENVLISGGNDGHIRIWSFQGEPIKSIPAHYYTVYSIILFADDIYASSSKDGSIKIWSGLFDKVIQKIDKQNAGHRHSVNALLKSDENCIISCSDDSKIKCFKKS